jgi:hypothetical protein
LQNSPIQLGSIELRDFEIPQSVRFGGRQRLAVHALAGGRRIVERLGPDDDDIQFRGIFSGPAAETRACAFDNLRLSGEIVWLSWESFRRRVIVKSFVANYHSPWWITYQVSCVAVHQAGTASSEEMTIAALISTDLSSAMSIAAGIGFSLTSLQSALSNTNALTASTGDQAEAIAEVGSTLQGVNGQIDQQSTALSAQLPDGVDAVGVAQSYVSKVDYARSLAAAVSMRSYIGRIGANITGLGA